MITRYQCTGCLNPTAGPVSRCLICGKSSAPLPSYFDRLPGELRGSLQETLRHLYLPDADSPTALLRLLSHVDDWLDEAERELGWQIIQPGRLADVLSDNGEPELAEMLRLARLDLSLTSSRQQRALHSAEAQVAIEAEIGGSLEAGATDAATHAWRRALNAGLALNPELTRSLLQARYQQRLSTRDLVSKEQSSPPASFSPSRRWQDHLDAQLQQRAAERAAVIHVWHANTELDSADDAANEQARLVASADAARNHDLQALDAAIATEDPAAIARAYMLMRARWPESLTESLHASGSRALRAWGNLLRPHLQEIRNTNNANA